MATAAAAVVAYVIGSYASAWLGAPDAPLLDGLSPPPPYRWVNPPPELEANNQAPESGSFMAKLTRKGSTAGAFSTPDTQATVIISEGSIDASPGQNAVAIDITPLDPATLGKPPSGLEFAGNAYEVVARYEPSGEPVEETTAGADQRVVLIYPAVAGEPEHDPVTMLHSVDGERWERLETSDSGATQQAQVTFESFGFYVVARDSDPGGLSSSALGVVILSVILLVLGALVIRRNIRRRPS